MGKHQMTVPNRPLGSPPSHDAEPPMNTELNDGCKDFANATAAPARGKSPGRVATARRLNKLGLRGVGGRKPTHGLRALQELLRRGQTPEGLAGTVLREYETALAGDFDGSLSAKEAGACRR